MNPRSSKYETAYACEGKTLTLECDPGNVINLIRANYGRFSITICNDHGNVEWSVNCMSPKSLRVLHAKCALKHKCSVLASTSLFGDPCPGTHKYLEAHYQCISALQTSTTTGRPPPPWITSAPSIWTAATVRVPVAVSQEVSLDVKEEQVISTSGVTEPIVTTRQWIVGLVVRKDPGNGNGRVIQKLSDSSGKKILLFKMFSADPLVVHL
uniref:Uncharacterized protein n=1 Tax=Phlebotomus papatasi TaxID=29031 RepID=A0A1B0DR50_PHLPP